MVHRLAVLAPVLALLLAVAVPAQAFDTGARAAIVIDDRTQAILFAKDPDEPIPPASMSKLMTGYLVFEALKDGRLKLDDTLTVSEHAWKMGGSQMFLRVGDRVKVEDLVRGMIVQSGNDACVVLAEAIAGSDRAFVDRMNEKAKELGLTHSHFDNVTGLPDPLHVMSVRDLATVAMRIVHDFPEYYRYYSEKELTYAGIRQANRNPLLQAGVRGVDGMKTGFTDDAGYGLVASAKRDGRRIFMVIAGLKNVKTRAREAQALLEYGFNEFQDYELLRPGKAVAQVAVWQGAADEVPATVGAPVVVTLPRGARPSLVVKLHYASPLPAPIAKGQKLGEAAITAKGLTPLQVPLVAGGDVGKAGVIGRLTGALTYLVWGRG